MLGKATPLSDAEPFEYSEESPPGNAIEIAARGVSEADEAECLADYELDLQMCDVARATFQDLRTLALCKARAFAKYQTCRGF